MQEKQTIVGVIKSISDERTLESGLTVRSVTIQKPAVSDLAGNVVREDQHYELSVFDNKIPFTRLKKLEGILVSAQVWVHSNQYQDKEDSRDRYAISLSLLKIEEYKAKEAQVNY